jgi:hypothetical protein
MANEIVPYENVERMAVAIAKSGLFGVKTPEQAMALMLVAQAEGLHPATAARDYDIIQGRPAKKSEAMLRSFLQNGGRVEWLQLDDSCAKAKFSHPQGGEVTIEWDMKRVAKAQISNTAMYLKYPRQMLRSRCLSEGIRTVCPMATTGMYIPEELADETPIVPVTTTPVVDAPRKPSRLDKIIDATTVEPEKENVSTPLVIPEDSPSTGKTTEAEKPSPEKTPEEMATGLIVGTITDFRSKEGVDDKKKKWSKWAVLVEGRWFGTFSNTTAQKLAELNAANKPVQILFSTTLKGDKQFYNIAAVSEAPEKAVSAPVADDDTII